MTQLASALKTEISRLARKEVKREVAALKRISARQRKDIAALRQELVQLRRLAKPARASARPAGDAEAPAVAQRFSAKGIASHRRRLGLSAAELARLLGASAQSVYNWEAGKARPRDSHIAALAALRGVGKRAVAARLQELG